MSIGWLYKFMHYLEYFRVFVTGVVELRRHGLWLRLSHTKARICGLDQNHNYRGLKSTMSNCSSS